MERRAYDADEVDVEIKSWEARVEHLKKNLKTYGSHKADCYLTKTKTTDPIMCTCGFRKALEGW